jgi:hypothetical protein
MFTVIHNGYKIQYFNTEEEVNSYIDGSLNTRVPCHKIFNRKIDKSTRLIRYKYDTLYEEDFLIEEDTRH